MWKDIALLLIGAWLGSGLTGLYHSHISARLNEPNCERCEFWKNFRKRFIVVTGLVVYFFGIPLLVAVWFNDYRYGVASEFFLIVFYLACNFVKGLIQKRKTQKIIKKTIDNWYEVY